MIPQNVQKLINDDILNLMTDFANLFNEGKKIIAKTKLTDTERMDLINSLSNEELKQFLDAETSHFLRIHCFSVNCRKQAEKYDKLLCKKRQ